MSGLDTVVVLFDTDKTSQPTISGVGGPRRSGPGTVRCLPLSGSLC